MKLFATKALAPEGWVDNLLVTIGADGRIAETSVAPKPPEDARRVSILLPAPANAHSHAFQRAMAGLTEARGPSGTDSFWTWRKLMYRFLDQLTPEDIEAIAAFVQMEMAEAGYATNIEFHYLHHQTGGVPYDRLSELSDRIAAAAETTGIGLTLLPVLYQYGGCDQRELGPGQIRFGNDMAQFAQLFDAAKATVATLTPDCGIGIAPHSLRAVAQEDLQQITTLSPNGPIHMHLAEQQAEVDEVSHHRGARPVEWALANLDLNPRWCLIHCTQMQASETIALAKSGAVAGLCPITESSLGDGIFDGVRWLENGGAIAIGSDSNIRISLSEELRTLEYSQRLRDHTRAALATAEKSAGRRIFDASVAGGAQAAARKTGTIAEGFWADLMVLNGNHVDLAARQSDQILDTFIFAGDDTMVSDLWSAGRHLVENGQHKRRDAITRAYGQTLARLTGRL